MYGIGWLTGGQCVFLNTWNVWVSSKSTENGENTLEDAMPSP